MILTREISGFLSKLTMQCMLISRTVELLESQGRNHRLKFHFRGQGFNSVAQAAGLASVEVMSLISNNK